MPNSSAWISKLDRAECIEIYKIRERLEPLALSESSANLSPETLVRPEDVFLCIEAAGSIDEFLQLDREFLSYEGAHMPQLAQMIHKLWNTTPQYPHAFAASVGSAGMAAVHHEHRLILEALNSATANSLDLSSAAISAAPACNWSDTTRCWPE
ncbi:MULTISPECIES: FCD domain-containing protein [unclassified Mesorhizobium]|uniref:FCD domain-containing protein n=1 Tax=unclassified Mesorhizobium TaxID=325217 RepID=UPI0016740F57|nr:MULTISPECIES: FCD domain-containing protein [unclassified Mesorhizobium]